jgi:trans-aconitate 2-methyltransferase
VSAREWNATSYDRTSAPLEALGLEVLDRLELCGDESVLDAGCGSGRVTEALVERIPRGRLIGVDGSAAMIATARRRLGDRAELLVCDLCDLSIAPPVDAVLSTATFHWIPDHARLFSRLHAALRPAGRLVAQCGGDANIAALHAVIDAVCERVPFAEHLAGWRGPWRFAGPAETEAALLGSGFTTAQCWLETRPVTPEGPREYLETIILGGHLDRFPPGLRAPFVTAVHAGVGARPTIDYVRLNIDATA